MSERVVNLHVLLQHVPSDAFFSQLPALEEDDFSQYCLGQVWKTSSLDLDQENSLRNSTIVSDNPVFSRFCLPNSPP